MRARWIAVLVATLLVGAAACDGPSDADPTVEPPSPTPSVTASSTPDPVDGEILRGVFETGFEHSGFYENAVCPEGSGSFWVSWTPESMFAERLEAETGVYPFSEPDVLAFRVTIRGEVSPPGEYGHLGQYPREVTVLDLIDAEFASDCDDEPSSSVGPPAVVAFGSDSNEVQLGLGSYCWQSSAGQPGKSVV